MKIAAFCTSNNAYIPKCCVSLLSLKKYNSHFDLYILSSNITQNNLALCTRLNIKCIDLESKLKKYFYKEWNYPKECYYHFKGPELFHKMGYDYSIYLDGDIYCNNYVDINWYSITHIAGVSYGTCKEFLSKIDDFKYISAKFSLNKESLKKKHCQTGVLYFNNNNLAKIRYFNISCELFDLSVKYDIPRKGDDSLMALLILYMKNLKIKYLPKNYNFIVKREMPYFTGHSQLIEKCIFFHCIKFKPWDTHIKNYPTYTYKYFVEKWKEELINEFTQKEICFFFPEIYKDINIVTDDLIINNNKYNKNKQNESEKINNIYIHKLFYWFSTNINNVGDWITPYLVNKICNINLKKSTNPLLSTSTVLLSTGSIMRLSNYNTIIWGSGIRDIDQHVNKPKLVRSVRGPLTRKRLIELGIECPVIYGDPALLLPLLYTPKSLPKKYKLGIIPHISQYEKITQIYSKYQDIQIIDFRTNNIESTIDNIVLCDKICSSGLHGIILSNAYDIPVTWIKFDNNIQGDDTKFYDYFFSIGRYEETYIDAVKYKDIHPDILIKKIHHYNINININKLLDSSIFDFKRGQIKKYILYNL